MDETFFWMAIVIFFIALLGACSLRNKSKLTGKYGKRRQKDAYVSTEDFQVEKGKLHPHFSQEEYAHFREFLSRYGGGYIRRRNGHIVFQDYLGKEKGDLKGIFYNLIVPNPNLTAEQKEDFRIYLRSIGVKGVDERPNYETRESKLKNRGSSEDEYRRKEVGNKGEQAVRDVLKLLNENDYAVINGPVLKYKDTAKEFDHIIVGKRGIFMLETKAFGMTDGKPCYARIFIDKGDKWSIKKNDYVRKLESPTEQIMEEKQLLEDILKTFFKEIHPVLVLSNNEVKVKNNIELPYDIVRVDDLLDYIGRQQDTIKAVERMQILEHLDGYRIN